MGIRNLINAMTPRKDPNGGVMYGQEHIVKAARKANLVSLPVGIAGQNCSNCHYFDSDTATCSHPDLYGIEVNEHMHCSMWWAPGDYKSWENFQPVKKQS